MRYYVTDGAEVTEFDLAEYTKVIRSEAMKRIKEEVEYMMANGGGVAGLLEWINKELENE